MGAPKKKINPIYTLYSEYLLGPNPLLTGSNRGFPKELSLDLTNTFAGLGSRDLAGDAEQ